MLQLSSNTRIFLGIIAGVAVIIAGVLGNILSPNIGHLFNKHGRNPTEKSPILWILFIFTALVSGFLGPIAAFASTPQEVPDITPSVTNVIQTETALPTETTPPTTTALPPPTEISTATLTVSPTPGFGQSIFWEWPQDRWAISHNNPRVEHSNIVIFHPREPNILVAGSVKGDLALLQMDTNHELDYLGSPIDYAHNGRIIDMLFMPSGDYLITTAADYELTVWLVSDSGILSNPFRTVTLSRQPTALALSRPQGSKIAIAYLDGFVDFHIPSNQYLIQTELIQVVDTIIWDIAYSDDGSSLYVANASNYVQIWQVEESSNDSSWNSQISATGGAIVAIDTSPINQNEFVISSIEPEVLLFKNDPEPLKVKSLYGEIWSLDYSPDGKFIAAGTLDCFVLLLDANDLTVLDSQYLCQDVVSTFSCRIESVQFSPDGTNIAVGYAKGVVIVPLVQEP
jgi:WD40 repeat protein